MADFLKDEIGAPNSAIIPYANQVVVLAEIFRVIGNPSAGQYAAIKRWFWRTTITGYFSGWNTGQMASDQAAVSDFVAGDMDAIDKDLLQPPQEIWTTRQFRANNASAKMFGLMISQKGPRDLVTGQKVALETALAWENSREYHHFFPQAFLKANKTNTRHINCIANFVLLTSSSNKQISGSAPSEYLKRCQDHFGDEFMNVLEANLISEDAYDAALHDDFEEFLKLRAHTLHQHANALCGW
jgi:hypothetical protein